MAACAKKILLSTILLSILSSAAAEAHPHVWVEMRSAVVFTDDGLIKGINLEWTFDDAYAQMAIDGLDVNSDGLFSPEELAPLTRENITALKEYQYFTVMRANGVQLQFGEVVEYGQVWSNDKLTLNFQVPLAKPVDPKENEFAVKIYDPEFFISFEYTSDEAVKFVGPMPDTCQLVVKPVPTDAELDQTRTMLSEKGADWKPEVSEDFGAMFAQAVTIDCKA